MRHLLAERVHEHDRVIGAETPGLQYGRSGSMQQALPVSGFVGWSKELGHVVRGRLTVVRPIVPCLHSKYPQCTLTLFILNGG